LWISFTYNENVSLNAGANIRMDITSLSSQGRFLVPTTPPAPTLSETNRIYNVDVMGGHIILFNISDDTFFSHTPQRKGGVLTITCYGAADIETFPQQVGSGIVFYDIGPSPLVQEWVDVNNGIEVSTSSSSTITDFTDGRLTVIARDGYLTFANRLNGTRSLRLSFS
jgi:hypothetical protein